MEFPLRIIVWRSIDVGRVGQLLTYIYHSNRKCIRLLPPYFLFSSLLAKGRVIADRERGTGKQDLLLFVVTVVLAVMMVV